MSARRGARGDRHTPRSGRVAAGIPARMCRGTGRRGASLGAGWRRCQPLGSRERRHLRAEANVVSKPKQQDDGQAGALPGLTIEEMTRLAALGSGDAVRMQCRAEEGRLARARSEAERIDRIVNSCGRCSTPQSNHVAWARCGGTPSISVPRNEPRFREKESQVFYFLILGDPVPPGRSQLPVPDRKELGSLLASLGAATCAWQQVEFSLYLIFQYAIGSPHRLALSAAFHEVRNFNNRLSMVNSALAQRFPELGTAPAMARPVGVDHDQGERTQQDRSLSAVFRTKAARGQASLSRPICGHAEPVSRGPDVQERQAPYTPARPDL